MLYICRRICLVAFFPPVQPKSSKAKSRRLVPARPRTSLYFKVTATEFLGLSLKSSRVVAANRVQQPITRQHSLALSSPEIDERVVASLLIATRLTKSIHYLLLLQSREMLDFLVMSLLSSSERTRHFENIYLYRVRVFKQKPYAIRTTRARLIIRQTRNSVRVHLFADMLRWTLFYDFVIKRRWVGEVK